MPREPFAACAGRNSVKINHLAAIVAAIAYYLWGALWFTLFAAPWRASTGRAGGDLTPMTFILSFLLGLALAYVIAVALADSKAPNMLRHGIEFGIFMGVGVWATSLLNLALYEGRPFVLWLIDAGYVVLGMAIMGAIIGGWRKRA